MLFFIIHDAREHRELHTVLKTSAGYRAPVPQSRRPDMCRCCRQMHKRFRHLKKSNAINMAAALMSAFTLLDNRHFASCLTHRIFLPPAVISGLAWTKLQRRPLSPAPLRFPLRSYFRYRSYIVLYKRVIFRA